MLLLLLIGIVLLTLNIHFAIQNFKRGNPLWMLSATAAFAVAATCGQLITVMQLTH